MLLIDKLIEGNLTLEDKKNISKELKKLTKCEQKEMLSILLHEATSNISSAKKSYLYVLISKLRSHFLNKKEENKFWEFIESVSS